MMHWVSARWDAVCWSLLVVGTNERITWRCSLACLRQGGQLQVLCLTQLLVDCQYACSALEGICHSPVT